jgi:ADP-ribosylglycohydrolase
MSKVLFDKVLGCLLAGLIGDAMGTPTEGKEYADIEQRFGWVDDFEGDGTDDSILKYLLCEALQKTNGYATADDWAAVWKERHEEVYGEKVNRFFISVLHTFEKLLRTDQVPREVSAGNLPSSSSAMCIAPVGIVNAGNPRMAAAQAEELGSLIHTGSVGFCQDGAAAIAAAVAEAFSPDATVDSVLDAATAYLKPFSGKLMRDLVLEAIDLAKSTGDYKEFRRQYHPTFRQSIGCDSRETVPATIALFYLAQGDPSVLIEQAANFGRDTDTIAAMGGAIAGAFCGANALRKEWLVKTEACTPNQRELAQALMEVALAKAETERRLWQRVLHSR